MVAKKRQRDEDEKKEKEKKKMRIECGQRQREHNGKNHVERTEKESQQSKDDQMNNKKEFNNESKRPQNRETTEGEAVDLQKTDTNLTLNEAVMNYEERVTSGLSCDAEVMHLVEKSPSKKDLIVQKIPEKSYDISPYQCSDDEDEEDDELPTKKYIPSWTSRSSIALLLPLKLKSVDADVIFPPDSSCSVDEVLQPRTLRVKQVAA